VTRLTDKSQKGPIAAEFAFSLSITRTHRGVEFGDNGTVRPAGSRRLAGDDVVEKL
jgi:hypothetical protein